METRAKISSFAIWFPASVLLLVLFSGESARSAPPAERLVATPAQGDRGLTGFDSLNVSRLGGWPLGPSSVVALDDARHLGFLNSGAAVLVLDVENPADPVLLSDAIWCRGYVQDLCFDEATRRLHVATGATGMEIWDLEAPDVPVKLGETLLTQYDLHPPILGIEVRGDYAYVAAEWGAIHRVDVSDPTNPFDYAYITPFSAVDDVFIAGDYLYSIGQELGKFHIAANGALTFIGDNPNHGRTVFVSGDYAYVPHNGDLYIFDVAGSHFPFVGAFEAGNIRDVVIVGDYAFAVDVIDGTYVLDISDPAVPTQVGFYDDSAANDIQIRGNVAYLPGGGGMHTADVADVSDPREIGFYDSVEITYEVHVAGERAYLANGQGLLVLDITDYEHPEVIARRDLTGPCYDVVVAGDVAYVSDQPYGLRTFDVTDPDDPRLMGGLQLTGYNREITLLGSYLYLVEPLTGFRIIDVTDPAAPTLTGEWTSPEWVDAVVVAGDLAYVANDEGGLRVLDVTDPASPVEIGAYQGPGWKIKDVQVVGDLAYVARWLDGLGILDVSDPTTPAPVGEFFISDWSFTTVVAVSGSYAYIDDQTNLIVVDCSDPAEPVEAGHYVALRTMGRMQTVSNTIHVPNGDVGYQIFRFLAPGSGAPAPHLAGPAALVARPNPFVHGTRISFTTPQRAMVSVRIYDARGRLVRSLARGMMDPGLHTVEWDGLDASGRGAGSSVYFARVSVNGAVSARRLIRLP